MNNFEIFNETNEKIKELSGLKGLLNYALDYLKLDNVEFNIIIIDNPRIHEMNKEYRGVDRETDVITFALEDHKDIEFEDVRILGDVYISIDKARSQSEEYGHSLKREISFLAIHGLLHLLGYDHMKPEDEKVMFDLQDKILDSYGIKREV